MYLVSLKSVLNMCLLWSVLYYLLGINNSLQAFQKHNLFYSHKLELKPSLIYIIWNLWKQENINCSDFQAIKVEDSWSFTI